MAKEIRIVEEGIGIWCVEIDGVVRIKFYDEKGKQQAKWFVQDYKGR